MKVTAPTVRASIAAILVPASVGAAAAVVLDPYTTPIDALFIFEVASLVAALHLVFLGIPVVLWLQRSSRLRANTLGIAGFVVGLVPTLVLQLVQLGSAVTPQQVCLSDAQCQSALLASTASWLGSLVAPVVAGVFGVLGALSYYAVIGYPFGARRDDA